jgi:hypothetical protein
LDKEVKDKEEHSRSDAAVVGGSGKGAEGVHFQGRPFFSSFQRTIVDDRFNDKFTFDPD